MTVVVHTANTHDTNSDILPAKKTFGQYPSIQSFCSDAGYSKTFEQNVSIELCLKVDISTHIKSK